MSDHPKFIERLLIGLVVAAVSLNILAVELPRVLPSLVMLAIVFVVVRLVLFHTRKW